jgi:HTH-type transcriptional regulator / antitoxin HipB
MNEYPIRIPQQLGPILQGFRRERKLTQQAVGTLAGLAQNAISEIEAKPGPASFDRIAKVLAALDLELLIRRRAQPNQKADW